MWGSGVFHIPQSSPVPSSQQREAEPLAIGESAPICAQDEPTVPALRHEVVV